LSAKATTEEAAVLFSEMTPDLAWEDEFNDWYDHEHIPLRMAVPGFLSAQRYRVSGAPHYLVVYEMQSAAVLQSPSYQLVKNHPSERTARMLRSVKGFSRYFGQHIHVQARTAADAAMNAPLLNAVGIEVPADRQRDFDDWLTYDHVPLLLECEDWLMVRCFHITSGEPKSWNRLALHYLADARALQSVECKRARSSPRQARLAQESWFQGQDSVFERYGPRHFGNSTDI
jgi:hypothetical protein